MDQGRAGPHAPLTLTLPQDHQDARRTLLHLGAEIIAYGDAIEGLIHEIRNPLQSLVFATRTLVDLPGSDPDGRLLNVIGEAADQAAASIELLSGAAEHRATSQPPVLLQDIVRRVLEWQRRSRFQIDGSLTSSIPSIIPPIAASDREIETALMLVVNNAKEAIGRDQPGTVEISASTSPNQNRVTIEIADTGSGIPSELEEAAFGLFVTTKEEHLGIGLSAARSLIESSGGTVLLRNRGGCGAICEISLPTWRE